MKYKSSISKLLILFCLIMGVHLGVAQEYKVAKQTSALIVEGTSNIHDWEIKAENQSGVITFKSIDNAEIAKLNFSVETESLKSGKSGMDKNTYKALNAKKYKTIKFNLIKVKETTAKGNNKYDVKLEGDLTISGTTKRITLPLQMEINAGTVKLTGSKKIKMTDYNIEPPTALFGTITTGDEVTIKIKTTLTE
ncbi:Polyisoprenoid-binding protein YceI [Zhouia amylolytica]|uniref:Polyisoprenoid-binding protein YceI n=1 Tax=Zhouia amylolytica TaxID=376730 RepID=A0A1I6V5Z1_9FLAO|nr:YceI family protein [Zhouia amylolytica]SFT09121.1 Polyisoprenoid-binding protein YceI [Zhouia amylolytica]